MRILFFSHYFPPEVNAPAARTYENCRRWVEAGHEVTVITCVPNMPAGVIYAGYRNRLYQREVVDGVQVVRVLTYVAANRGTIRRTLNFLTYAFWATVLSPFAMRRPDVVIATSPQFFCGWTGAWTARFRRCPFLLEVRDLWPESIVAVEARLPSPIIRYLEWLERRLYQAARHIVTVGAGYKERIQLRGVAPDKISVIMNGVNPEPPGTAAEGAEVRARLDLSGRFVVGYIGTIGMAAGLDVVLRAARRLRDDGHRDVHFLVVGDGATRAELEEAAQAQRLENVHFIGRRSRREVPAHLNAVDACLVHLRDAPLFRSVMPSKIFEAAGAGRPILLGVEGFAADWVRNAEAGVCFPPEDEEALCAAILALRRDPEACTRYGDSGRAYVLRHNTRENLAREYLNLVSDIAVSRATCGEPH